ncbi:hypothetical protein [Mycoplasma anserisalpingitidis]|uniref:hypothetical protein n=1 Tax=Mycoplasma anserisalpingitidis TaxID=519450 RepID=UPI0011B128C1|nr:hypothetical protein [Mycoplasma anserisalpingitidis]QDY87770.1 hypothetical protein FOY45_02425 [Mycoplasma anserisalpingitidis]
MKRKINKLWLLLGAVSVASTPIMASSCIYENHPSVVFAKNFIKSNYWKDNAKNIENKISEELSKTEIRKFYDEIMANIKLQSTFSGYDIFTPNSIITINVTGRDEQEINALLKSMDSVVRAVLEETPFYALYLMNKNSILKRENNKITFDYKSSEAVFNYIQASDFVHLLDLYKSQLDKSIENVYKNVVFDYIKNKPFNFDKYSPYYNEYKNNMSITHSIVAGLGPVYVLNNTDKVGRESDETKVFAEKLSNDDELSEEFMNSPVEFVEDHPDLLYYDSYHGEIERTSEGIYLHGVAASERMIKETLIEIEELTDLALKYRELKSENRLEEANKAKEEMLNYINNSQYLKQSYEKQVEYVKDKKSKTISNIYHYVEFYALSLFLLGYKNIELISLEWPEGTEYSEFNKTNLRYFVIKIKDSKGQIKYLDPYRDYMNYSQNKEYNFGQVYDNIPQGFTISSEFK